MDRGVPRGLSGNQLKIIAALAMTIDHIGVMIFPDVLILRIIGRLALGLLFIALVLNGVQAWSMLALIPLYFYNGKRGKMRMKYFFYIYYPIHLGVIHLISLL